MSRRLIAYSTPTSLRATWMWAAFMLAFAALDVINGVPRVLVAIQGIIAGLWLSDLLHELRFGSDTEHSA